MPIFFCLYPLPIQKDKAKNCSSEKEVRGDHCTILRSLSVFIGTSSTSMCVCVLNKSVLLNTVFKFTSRRQRHYSAEEEKRRGSGGTKEGLKRKTVELSKSFEFGILLEGAT